MRKQIKNLIIVILMVLISFNSIFPPITYAEGFWDPFTNQIESWLENKLKEYPSYKEKKEYILYFMDSWREELGEAGEPIDYKYIEESIEVCNAKVSQIADRKLQILDIEMSESISKEMAIESLKYKLGELKGQKEEELKNLEEEEKNIKIQEYFQDLKNKHIQTTGEFYDDTIKIANKIAIEEDREEFLNNVPNYIEQFINDTMGKSYISENNIFNLFSFLVDGISGTFLSLLKILFVVVPGAVIQVIETLLASIGNENGVLKFLTIDNIFFNEVALVDINVFDLKTAGDSTISNTNVLLNIRNSVAKWYYAIRNLSIVLGLAVLVYIGVRMAISSIADEKAKYKKMLKDWLVSFALIFVLHYFMIFIMKLNDGIIQVLANTKDLVEEQIGLQVPLVGETLQGKLLIEAFHPLLLRGLCSAILYFILVIMTLLYLIVYIKRFITICILVIISPLITVTYAIDKAGDGKAQAFNKWMGEFVFTVLIQPFHCIIYMVFLQNIFAIINDTTGVLQFGKIFVAIIILGFIYKAEDIVRAIFGFKANNLSSAAAVGALALSKVGQVNNISSSMKGVKNAGAKAKAVKNIKTPNSLPSQAGNARSPSRTPNNAQQRGATQPGAAAAQRGTNKGAKVAKTLGKAATLGIGNTTADKVARSIAKKVIAGAIGYGLTGDYGGIIAGNKGMKAIGKKKDEMLLASRVKDKEDSVLDAYQDYKETHGLSDEDMLDKCQELQNTDINSINDEQDRNLAEHLQATKSMYEILGSDDSERDLMGLLNDYEGH